MVFMCDECNLLEIFLFTERFSKSHKIFHYTVTEIKPKKINPFSTYNKLRKIAAPATSIGKPAPEAPLAVSTPGMLTEGAG